LIDAGAGDGDAGLDAAGVVESIGHGGVLAKRMVNLILNWSDDLSIKTVLVWFLACSHYCEASCRYFGATRKKTWRAHFHLRRSR
jgi:hypothetical protein